MSSELSRVFGACIILFSFLFLVIFSFLLVLCLSKAALVCLKKCFSDRGLLGML